MRQDKMFADIETSLSVKPLAATQSASVDRPTSASLVRKAYATAVPAQHNVGVRARGTYKTGGVLSGAERPSRHSTRVNSLTRKPSIELVSGPLIRQVEIRFFSRVCRY